MGNQNKVQQTGDNSIEGRKHEWHHPSITVFITGSFSAVVCSVTLQPLDVLKTRLQNPIKSKSSKTKRFGIYSILKHIYKHENLGVLWYGTTATVLRGVPAGGLYFCVYDWLKSSLYSDHPPTSIQHILLAMVARAITDTAIIPLTVVKTRVESGMFKYDSVLWGITRIYRKEGMTGLTSGLLPVLARDLPMSGTYIFFYNQTQKVLPTTLHEKHEHIVHSTCAGISAVLSAIVTHPPDVIKTQMQLYPKKYPTINSVITKTYKEYGSLGFLQGLLPRLIKRTVFAVISWTLYENIKT